MNHVFPNLVFQNDGLYKQYQVQRLNYHSYCNYTHKSNYWNWVLTTIAVQE